MDSELFIVTNSLSFFGRLLNVYFAIFLFLNAVVDRTSLFQIPYCEKELREKGIDWQKFAQLEKRFRVKLVKRVTTADTVGRKVTKTQDAFLL